MSQFFFYFYISSLPCVTWSATNKHIHLCSLIIKAERLHPQTLYWLSCHIASSYRQYFFFFFIFSVLSKGMYWFFVTVHAICQCVHCTCTFVIHSLYAHGSPPAQQWITVDTFSLLCMACIFFNQYYYNYIILRHRCSQVHVKILHWCLNLLCILS